MVDYMVVAAIEAVYSPRFPETDMVENLKEWEKRAADRVVPGEIQVRPEGATDAAPVVESVAPAHIATVVAPQDSQGVAAEMPVVDVRFPLFHFLV